jgi:hypothetical protein
LGGAATKNRRRGRLLFLFPHFALKQAVCLKGDLLRESLGGAGTKNRRHGRLLFLFPHLALKQAVCLKGDLLRESLGGAPKTAGVDACFFISTLRFKASSLSERRFATRIFGGGWHQKPQAWTPAFFISTLRFKASFKRCVEIKKPESQTFRFLVARGRFELPTSGL